MGDFGYFYWDPSREMFSFEIPFLHRPILWYGFLFALGFFLGYWVLLFILRRYFFSTSKEQKKISTHVAEKISLYVILGTVIGARLGDVLFYENWSRLKNDPWDVFRIWEGGLASHGGAIGILTALFILSRKWKKDFPQFTWVRLIDLVCIPTALAAGFIRIGNFINQEILGIATTQPWGVIFGHPVDGGKLIPRHPVQLYEAMYYFAVFGVLSYLWTCSTFIKKPGKISGLFLILIFGFRFFVEFLKVEQSSLLPVGFSLTMGQLLSLPLIFLGLWLFWSDKFLRMKSIKRH